MMRITRFQLLSQRTNSFELLALPELPGSQMDLFYRSYSYIRAIEFKALDTSSLIVEDNLKILGSDLSNLLSFENLDVSRNNDRIDYLTSPLAEPSTGVHSLTLSIAAHNSRPVFGNGPATDRDYTANIRDNSKWTPPASVTPLNIRDVRYPQVLLDTIASTPVGLT